MKWGSQSTVISYTYTLLAALFLMILFSGNGTATAVCEGAKGIEFGISPTNINIQRGQTLSFNWTVTACTTPDYVNFTIAAPDGSVIVDQSYPGSSGMLVNYTWVVPVDASLGLYWSGVEYYPYRNNERAEGSAHIKFWILPTPKLTLVKTVVNNNGGIKEVPDFPLFIDGTDGIPATSGVAYEVPAYVEHTASEIPQAGYAPSAWGGDCAADGTIMLLPGDEKTCTITNDDVQPILHVIKQVVNDNGGSKVVSNFDITVTGSNPNPASFAGDEAGTTVAINQGTYNVDEAAVSGYDKSLSAGCSGSINVGDEKTCTITNDDQPAHIIVIKTVINDNGGNNAASSFTMHITGTAGTANFAGSEDGVDTQVGAGTFSVSEDEVAGYTSSTSGDCSGSIANGETKTCTITNNDIVPTITLIKNVISNNGGNAGVNDFGLTVGGNSVSSDVATPVVANTPIAISEAGLQGYSFVSITGNGCPAELGGTVTPVEGQEIICTITNDDQPAHLIVVKHVVNDNNGAATAAAFTMTINGVTATDGNSFDGEESPGVDKTLTSVGSYSVTESGPSGYSETDSVDCSGTIALSETKICTITNDDVGSNLTVIKVVINDNGGTAVVSDFPLFVNDSSVTSGISIPVSAGDYLISETSQQVGYSSSFSDDCDANGLVVVGLSQNKTCIITNNDNAPSLTLIKEIFNDNGGTAMATDWTLSASGPTSISGTTPVTSDASFDQGEYTLSESTVLGYTASSWVCIGGTQDGNKITLGLGESATCTITNDDEPGTLTVIKHVTNDNGGLALASQFTMAVTGTNVQPSATFAGAESPGTTVTLNAGSYSVKESGPSGYAESDSTDCTGTIANGEEKTCTITNDDKPGTLIVIKHVVNDNAGTKAASDFRVTVTGTNVLPSDEFDGAESPGTTVTLNAGEYGVDEAEVLGYQKAFSLDCSGSIANGETKTCTITNDDDPKGKLIIVKQVINDNGGYANPSDFTITVNGNNPSQSSFLGADSPGTTVWLDAGEYSVSESGPSGYSEAASEGCNGVIGVEDTITCTITNDDIQPKLTVTKVVNNNHGGKAVVADFPLFVDQTPVTSEVQNGFDVSTYTVSETGQIGYTSAITGDCGTDGSITLQIGDAKICTITNNDIPGNIKIVKNTFGGDDTFGFTVEGPSQATPSVQTSGGIGDTGFITSDAGSYSISETNIPAGWDLTGSSCTSGSPDSFTLPLDGSITCTFENTKRGHLIVHKVTDPSSDTETLFSITASGTGTITDPATATITGGSSHDYEVTPGTYSVSENALPGWDTIGNCNDVVVDAGQIQECTITNTQRGTIIVEKQTDPDGAPVSFTFTGDASGSISDNGQITVNNLVPGTYIATETDPTPSFDLTAIQCDDQSSATPSSGDVASRLATFKLDAGETVMCTFTNTQRGEIHGQKFNDMNGDGLWDEGEPTLEEWTINLNGDAQTAVTDSSGSYGFTYLKPGLYTITETLQDGWVKTTADPAPVNLNPGQIVESVNFGNFKFGEIHGTKFEDLNGDRFKDTGEPGLSGWAINLAGPDQSSTTSTITDGNGNYQFTGLHAGTYTLTEAAQDGWIKTTADPEPVLVQSGTNSQSNDFGNFQLAKIIVHKNVLNPDGGEVTDVHQFTVNLDDANPQTIAEGTDATYGDLGPGTYSITEDSAANYDFDPISQSQVTTTSGSTTEVFVVNKQKKATITVVKDVLAPDGVTDVADDHGFSVTLNSETNPFKEGLSALFTVNPGTYDAVEAADGDYELVSNDGPAIVGSSGEATITIKNKQKPAEIRGVKFNDSNANGARDGGDTGLQGWIIYLDANDDGLFDSGEIFAVTGQNGEYSFTNLIPGTYHVREVLNDGWMQTAPDGGKHDVTLAIGQVADGKDFGNFALATIIVHKNVVAFNGEDIVDPHPFIVRLDNTNPKLIDEGTVATYSGLGHGTYTVSEDNDASYNLISITPSTVTLESGSTTDIFVVNKQKNLASITTFASSSIVILGDSVYDTATLLGVPDIPITGTVSFYVCNTPTCLTGGTLLGTVVVGPNDGTSVTVIGPTFTPTTAGSYSFRAEYSGDENYAPSIDDGTNESFVVEQMATRTVYFWETHTGFTSSIFTSELGGIMTVGDITHLKMIDNTQSPAVSKLFGAYYSDVSKKTNDEWRTSADYARMMLLQQLVTAKLNCAAFGCSVPINALIAAADTAYAGDDADLMLSLGAQLEAFNNSGEAQAIPPELGPVGSETPETSESIADKVFWNTP